MWDESPEAPPALRPADGDNCQFRRISFDVVLLLVDKAPGNEQRKSYVLVPRGFETPVERLLDVFPQRPAVRAHDHAAAHWGVIRQLGAKHQLVVPFGKLFRTRRKFQFRHTTARGKYFCI